MPVLPITTISMHLHTDVVCILYFYSVNILGCCRGFYLVLLSLMP